MIQFQQLLSLLALAPVAWAKFSSPDVENGAKPAWTVGDRQVVAWDSSDNHADEVNVTLWQQFPVGEGAKNIALVYCMALTYFTLNDVDVYVLMLMSSKLRSRNPSLRTRLDRPALRREPRLLR